MSEISELKKQTKISYERQLNRITYMVISVIKLTSLLISALPEGPMVCGCALFVSTFKESVDCIVLFMSCNGFLGIPYSLRRSLNIVHELKAMFVSSYLVFFFVFLLLLSSLRHS